ncbi:unnamed protein product [Thelazia callipaeda]|uniref:E2 ubiquitin-conjugating enzyme n=1 Tax=Thelazia callipaeda TaxID=103827 RepID=A0A0N5DAI0_THECL|nr:unnamed protein product [Thelazia callipaeda]
MASSSRRLQKELVDIQLSDSRTFCCIEFDQDNLLHWTGLLLPDKEPYNKGAFKIAIDFPVEYPFKPPKITFLTKIYHPNVDEKGQVCLPLISPDNWKPTTKTEQVMSALLGLITEPEPDHPLRADIAEEFTKDRKKFNKAAEDYTKKYGMKRPDGYIFSRKRRMQEDNVMTVLVTGGTGLLGRALQQIVTTEEARSNEKWIFVGQQDCDLMDREATRLLFSKHRPSHVVHLAALVGGLYHNLRCNLQFFLKNMVIFVLYFYVENAHVFEYSEFLDSFKPKKYTSVIPCNVFGPYDNYNLQNGHVLPALIHKTYIAKRDKAPLEIFGSGKPLRQFIYSLDLARLFVWVVRSYEEIDPIILSVGENDEISILEAVRCIIDAFKFKGEVLQDKTKADGQYRKTASNAKMRKYLPHFKFTPFEVAIKESVDWFIANYDIARK